MNQSFKINILLTTCRSYYEAASTFRPQQPAAINIATPRPTPFGRSLPKIPANESMTIPSVPGYAKPYAHVNLGSGNLPPPPAPPSTTPPSHAWNSRPSESASRLLETSLDDDDVRGRRTRPSASGYDLAVWARSWRRTLTMTTTITSAMGKAPTSVTPGASEDRGS